MIKNILKLKLFVLCSMLFCSLVVSVFCFGTFSKAYVAPDNVSYNYYQNMGGNWEYYSNLPFCYIRNHTNNNASAYPMLTIVNIDNVNYVAKIQSISNSNNVTFSAYDTENHNFTSFSSDLVQIFYNGGTRSGNYNMTCQTANIDSDLFFEDYDSALHYLEVTSVGIDWDNPFYSANIVAPNMRITYRELSSTPVVDVPLNIQIASYPSTENEYYVQLFGLVNYDQNYYVQNTRDGIIFNGLDLERYTSYIDIVTPDELLKASDLSFDMLHLRFSDGWYNNFPSDSLFSFTFQDGIPGPLQTSAINKFNSFRKNATFADNTVYVYARYFVIDNDDNFVVGPWRIWKSYNPNEFTTEVPNYYLPYGVAPGTEGTNTSVTPVSTSSPEPSVIDNPVQTNPTVNITVSQNVPNYPDYPTIASYNKDNLLVDTMNQLTSIQGFFGEFGSFLVTAFAFMPAWIWAIIGVGFSLSIVVMFLKIL